MSGGEGGEGYEWREGSVAAGDDDNDNDEDEYDDGACCSDRKSAFCSYSRSR